VHAVTCRLEYLRDVVASFCQLNYSTTLAALLVAILSRELLKLHLVLVLFTDVDLGALIERVLAADACQLATGFRLADGIHDLGRLVGHVCRWMQELCACWIAAVYTEPVEG
jgi:hypothetical protein